MNVLDCIQGTEEWHKARCGVPTASEFDKIITSKGEPSKQRTKYLYQLAGERLAGVQESYQNGAMQRGTDLEGEARDLYRFITDSEVQEIGFCLSDNGLYGASPDGLVGEKGGLEIKCPALATHIGYLVEGVLPTDYVQQVFGNLLVTGRDWWDFMSYFPGIKPLIVRANRDEVFLKKMQSEIDAFCQDLDKLSKQLGGAR